MNNIKFICLCLAVFLFTGCINEYSEYYKSKYVLSTEVTDFNSLTQSLVKEMDEEIQLIIPKSNKIIYVSDFVNIENLEVTSQLGLFLASEVKTHITRDYNLKIREIAYTKYLKLNNTGFRTLSRNLDDIDARDLKKSYILAGTYVVTQRQLILYLKLIDMKNGTILRTTTTRMNLTDEILKLENKNSKANFNYRPRVIL